MSALADFSYKFGSQPRELKIGQSFFADDADTVFHTIRYDFVPASIDPNKTSAIDFGENGKVTITMPNLEGSGTTESVYQGQRKPHQKECVLIINNETGDMILERLNQSVIVKKARLRQEDLTGKSLALNNKGPTTSFPINITTNNNGNGVNNLPLSINASSNNPIKNNSLSGSEKKSLLGPHKTQQQPSQPPQQQNPAKKQSPSLPNGNMLNNATTSAISRPNAMANKPSTNISPPSMPVFNTKLNAKINNNSNTTDINNLDWKIKMPDPPDLLPKMTSKSNSRNLNSQSSNCLSELSSSESSDSDADSSSDHFSDNENDSKVNSKSTVLNVMAPSMPSLVATLSHSPDASDTNNNQKKSSLALLLSDSSSDDEVSNNNNVDKSFKTANIVNKSSDISGDSTTALSMPKFSQLSQDLQLSESDSDD